MHFCSMVSVSDTTLRYEQRSNIATSTADRYVVIHIPQFTSVRDGNFFGNRVINHWNLLPNRLVSSISVANLPASSVNSGLLIFTCNFSVMSTCNTGHLSEQDHTCLGVL